MRDKRNGLRPVSTTWNNKEVKGYFHCFSTIGSSEEGMDLYATIELEDGKLIQQFACDIKFEDVD